MKYYAISGLGADHRAFNEMKQSLDIEVLQWKTPEPNEPLSEYAKRLSFEIDDNHDFNLIGLSFGGLVANELSKHKPPKNLILISSASNYKDIPSMYRFAGSMGWSASLPSIKKIPLPIINKLFGTPSKSLLKSIIDDTDRTFERWAVDQLCRWRGAEPVIPWIAIHGSNDRILPNPPKSNCTIIKGGHLIVLDEAQSIIDILNEKLS